MNDEGYPEKMAVKVWEYRGVTLSVTYGGFPRHYNGYVRLGAFAGKIKMSPEAVSVHGGITYNKGGVLGFDCSHWGDDHILSKTHNLKWVMRETERMADQLLGV